jgi:TetR/AcrR family transcriptional repressor of nem operon
MRYPPGHKEESRQRLLRASGPLVKKNGFAKSGVDALMRSAGLSGAALYTHFASKDQFFAAVVEAELAQTRRFLEGDAAQETAAWFAERVDLYLSAAHVEHPEKGCALPCLSPEVARSKRPVKQAYEKAVQRVIRILSARLGAEDQAWAVLSQCIGAVALARAMDSPAKRRKILASNRTVLKRSLARPKGSVG